MQSSPNLRLIGNTLCLSHYYIYLVIYPGNVSLVQYNVGVAFSFPFRLYLSYMYILVIFEEYIPFFALKSLACGAEFPYDGYRLERFFLLSGYALHESFLNGLPQYLVNGLFNKILPHLIIGFERNCDVIKHVTTILMP